MTNITFTGEVEYDPTLTAMNIPFGSSAAYEQYVTEGRVPFRSIPSRGGMPYLIAVANYEPLFHYVEQRMKVAEARLDSLPRLFKWWLRRRDVR